MTWEEKGHIVCSTENKKHFPKFNIKFNTYYNQYFLTKEEVEKSYDMLIRIKTEEREKTIKKII